MKALKFNNRNNSDFSFDLSATFDEVGTKIKIITQERFNFNYLLHSKNNSTTSTTFVIRRTAAETQETRSTLFQSTSSTKIHVLGHSCKIHVPYFKNRFLIPYFTFHLNFGFSSQFLIIFR